MTQAPGLARIDVVATRRVAEGLFTRLRHVWPSASEVRVPRQRPDETRLETTSTERRWIACRDRDEEVLAYARRVKALQPADASTSALVYRRPLPYLYAAQFVLGAAGIPFQSSGTLPLAAEPWAAGLDLLMDAALSGFTRATLVTLLRSPHVLVRRADGAPVEASDVAAFDVWLARQRYLGTLDHLDHLLSQPAAPAPSGVEGRPERSRGRLPSSRYVEEWRQEQAARAVGDGGAAVARAAHAAPVRGGRCRRTSVRCATPGGPANACHWTAMRRRAAHAVRVPPWTCCWRNSNTRSAGTIRRPCRLATRASSFVGGSRTAPSRCRPTTRVST